MRAGSKTRNMRVVCEKITLHLGFARNVARSYWFARLYRPGGRGRVRNCKVEEMMAAPAFAPCVVVAVHVCLWFVQAKEGDLIVGAVRILKLRR